MVASKQLTGAARKASRQDQLSAVRDEQPQEQQMQPTLTEQSERAVSTLEAQRRELADLQSKAKALREQIRTEKANQPAREPKATRTLNDVIARQEASVGVGSVLYLGWRAMARVKMGQPMNEAVDAVVAQEAAATKGTIEYFQSGGYGSMRAAFLAWASVNAPLAVTRQHVRITDEGDTSDER